MTGLPGLARAGWRIEERFGSPPQLHGAWASVESVPDERAVALCRPTSPAVVLGSTQPERSVNRSGAAAAGLDVVRRRSGGGAVLVTPEDPVWIDAWVPAGDPLWSDDVTRAFGWLGALWGSALESLGLSGVSVQGASPGRCTRWSTVVCFGGVGAGEVSVDGRKTVGLAQRRTRQGAWFHAACVVRWNVAPLLVALNLDDVERDVAHTALSSAVTGVADAAAAQGITTVPTAETVRSAFPVLVDLTGSR